MVLSRHDGFWQARGALSPGAQGRMVAMRSPAITLAKAILVLSLAVRLNGQVIGASICGSHAQRTKLGQELSDRHLAECVWSGLPSCRALEGCKGSVQDVERPQTEGNCVAVPELFSLKKQDLPVLRVNGGVLFTAGMTIDADGAPNAYGPKNRGLDFTANARGRGGWVALVTNTRGRPVIQRTGPYRGYYVSTTSLQQQDISDPRNPKKYLDATRIPYIALPPDFTREFGISLGDLAVVVNVENGRTAYAIFADVGPRGKIGEGSIALANKLGIPSNPRHDSVLNGVTYLVFPGSGSSKGKSITMSRINSSAARLHRQWSAQKNCAVAAVLSKNEDQLAANKSELERLQIWTGQSCSGQCFLLMGQCAIEIRHKMT